MDYRILGPLEVRTAQGVVRLGSPRQRLLLTVFLVEANRVVSLDRLVEELWGDVLPTDPEGALRTQVSRLRKALGAVAQLTTEEAGYRLSVGRHELDAARFEDLLSAIGAGDDETVAFLDEALSLWRGPVLAGFAHRAFAQPEAVRLEELHLAARERRAELLLGLDRTAEATGDLEALLAEHPERERARGLLMEALYRQGRHTEALATYQAWRRSLAEELGLEPSPALRRLEQEILQHTLAPAETPAGIPGLPLPVSSFVGRDGDVSGVRDLLEQVRVLTLCGPAGVGKTRLALEVGAVLGERYPDGIHFVDLAAVTRAADVVRTLAATLGVEERALRRLDDRLVEHLADQQALVVLDNCEHVIGAAAGLAERMVQHTRGVDVLATSRERLAIDGEHLWIVTPLSTEGTDAPAVRLFLDRARAVDPGFTATEEALITVTDICCRLDGLPLTIELATGRLHGMGIEDLYRSLDRRFQVLTGGRRTSSRHRSLRAVLDWSYEALELPAGRVFERLATFAGRFGLDAARAVAAGDDLHPDDVTAAVLRLADCSLLAEHRGAGPNRYSLLDTMRSYGVERLEAQGALASARDRHAQWALELAERAAAGLGGPREGEWARAVREHLDEFRAAHSWLVGRDPERSLRLAVALHPYALWRGQSEVFRWAEVAAGAAAGAGSPLLPAVLASAAAGAWQRGDLDAAEATAGASLDAARGYDPAVARHAMEQMAELTLLRGDVQRAAAFYREASDLARGSGDLLQAVWDLGSASLAVFYAAQQEQATDIATETLALAEATGSPSARALAHYAMGEISASTDMAASEHHLRLAVALGESVESRFVVGWAEVTLATLRARQGDAGAALRYYESVIGEWQRVGAWTPQWVTLRSLLDLLVRLGAFRDAGILYGAAEAAQTGARPFGTDEAMLREAAAHLRAELGEDTFRRVAGQGAELTEDEIIGVALDAVRRAAQRVCSTQAAPLADP